MVLIVLNTKAVLHQHLSAYKRLKSVDSSALLQYELIDNGTGIHWPLLDEDLSLKGFLRDKLRNPAINSKEITAA